CDLLAVVVAERLVERVDRGRELAAGAQLRAEGGVVVADVRAGGAAAHALEATQIVLAVHGRAAALVLPGLALGAATGRVGRLGARVTSRDRRDYTQREQSASHATHA